MGWLSNYINYRRNSEYSSAIKKLDKQREKLGEESYHEKLGAILDKWKGVVSSPYQNKFYILSQKVSDFYLEQTAKMEPGGGDFPQKMGSILSKWSSLIAPAHKNQFMQARKNVSSQYASQAKQLQGKRSSMSATVYQKEMQNLLNAWNKHLEPEDIKTYAAAAQSMKLRIVTLRDPKTKTAQFVNVDEVLDRNNPEKIAELYVGLFRSVPSFEGGESKAQALQTIEGELFAKLEKTPQVTTLHQRFTKQLALYESRSKSKIIVPKPEAMQKLDNVRLQNPEKELDRLGKIPSVQKLFETIDKNKMIRLTPEQKVAIGRSQELRVALSKTHYVANHGQSSQIFFLTTFSKIMKKVYDQRFFVSALPLRHNLESERDLAFFRKKMEGWSFNDADYSNELISADFVFYNSEPFESAISFYTGAANIALDDTEFVKKKMMEIANQYFPDQNIAEETVDKTLNLYASMEEKPSILYSIAIPREQFESSAYFSAAYGIEHKNKAVQVASKEYLEGEQEELIELPEDVHNFPQLRILASKIDPSKGFHVVASEEAEAAYEGIEEKMQDLILSSLAGLPKMTT